MTNKNNFTDNSELALTWKGSLLSFRHCRSVCLVANDSGILLLTGFCE